MQVRNATRATTVGSHITIADTSLSRFIGLLGKRRLDAGCGLLLKPSSGVHTVGMLFSIDVVALSRSLQVRRLWHCLVPFRMTSIDFRTHCVLELPPGRIQECGIQVGDQLEFID